MAYIIPGNLYVNGQPVTFRESVDDNGRPYKYIILSYFEKNIIEFTGSLVLSMKNRYDATRTDFSLTFQSNDDYPAYIDIADVMSRYFHKGYNDFYQPVSSVPVVVEESAMTVDAILISGGTTISFKLVLIQSSSNEVIDKWCQSAYYTGENQEFYVYYFAKDGEPPEEFEWEDPFEPTTEDVYCCDNLGPAIDVDSEAIDNSGTTSLENGYGATFFCDDNSSFPFKNSLSGINCKLVSGVYPHTLIDGTITLRTQISSYSVAEGDEDYLLYSSSQYLYYDRYNRDFSSNIGDILVFNNGWQCKVVDAFDGILPNTEVIKHFVIVDKPIMPYWGILSQSQNPYSGGNYWRDMFGYEKFYDGNNWEYYDYAGELANNENLNRLRCFITENENEYVAEQQKLYTFDIDISSLFTLTLHPNNLDFGTATGGGPYQFGDYAVINALPATGYEFVTWGNQVANPTTNPNQFQVYEDTTINVTFTPILEVTNFHIDSTSNPSVFFLIADVVDNVAERGFLIKADGVPTLDDYDEKFEMAGSHINKIFSTEEDVYVVAYSTYRGQAVYSQSEQILINPSPIPSAYQLVEWISGTGNPRISTSVKDDTISKIEAMWRCSYSQTTGFAWTGTLQSSPSRRCGWGIRNSSGHLEAWWGTYANTCADLGAYDKTATALKKIVIDVTNKNASFNGGTPVALGNGTLATTGQNFYLFVDSNSSTLPSTQYFGNVKIYNLSGTLVRDLYPVRRKSDNVGMMYDIVSNEVFANIFVGSFEVGPDKQWED